MALPDMRTEPLDVRVAQASEWLVPRPLQWAPGLSVGLHIGALLGVPDWSPQPVEDPPRLTVTLRPPAATPSPAPIVIAARQAETQRTPPDAPRPAPVPALPDPVVPRPKMSSRSAPPLAMPLPRVATQPEPHATPRTVSATDTPAARTEAKPASETATALAPMPAPAPSALRNEPADRGSAAPAPVATVAATASPAQLEAYGASLGRLFSREQVYPRLAAMRGWEGEVVLRISIARKGKLVALRILRSSGHEVLDRNAESLVSALSPFPAPPDELSTPELEITVPIHYRLERAS